MKKEPKKGASRGIGKDASVADEEELILPPSSAGVNPDEAVREAVVVMEPDVVQTPVDRSFLEQEAQYSIFKRHDRILRGTKGVSQPDLHQGNDLEVSKPILARQHSAPPERNLPDSGSEVFKIAKPPFMNEIEPLPMCDEMSAALRLRERRLLRKKTRALGIPPDPNDSDDSLLAELNEATDEKLFPGLVFAQKEESIALDSAKPIRLHVQHQRKKISKLKKTEFEGKKASPQQIFNSLPPTIRQLFEDLVHQSHLQDNAEFPKPALKGGIKSCVLKEMEALNDRSQKNELELSNLMSSREMFQEKANHFIQQCMSIGPQICSLSDLEEISETVEAEIEWPKSKLFFDEGSPLDFEVPTAALLTATPQLQNLYKSYEEFSAFAKECLSSIDSLNAAIISIEHDLQASQSKISDYKFLLAEILESDIVHQLEAMVITRVKLEASLQQKKAGRKEAAAQPKNNAQKGKHNKSEQADDLRERNLSSLRARVTKIRKAIAEHEALKKEEMAAEEEEESQTDLSQMPGVREVQHMLRHRQKEDDKQRKVNADIEEGRKMFILKKLLAASDLERAEHRVQKSKETLCETLEHLAPRPYGHKTEKRDFKLPPIESVPNQTSESDPTWRKKAPQPNHKIITGDERKPQLLLSSPFMPEPAAVMFADYEPDVTYSKTIKITNTSCRVNAFKILPLAVDLATLFEVKSPPSGRLSAGMVAEVTFVFKPPTGFDQDVFNGEVLFEAEYGGRFSVKLGCSTKKCRPRISCIRGANIAQRRDGLCSTSPSAFDNESDNLPVDIDFGKCVQGGTVTRLVDITNYGAISTIATVSIIRDEESDEPFYLESKGASNLIIEGHSTVSFKLTFEPARSSLFDHEVLSEVLCLISFASDVVPPIKLSCSGIILPAPLRINQAEIDFGTCAADSSYRESILISNHSNQAIKFWVEIDGMSNRIKNFASHKGAGKQRAIISDTQDFGSMICTDGIDSDEDRPRQGLSFFSDDSLFPDSGSIHNSFVNLNQKSRSSARVGAPLLGVNLFSPNGRHASSRSPSVMTTEDVPQFSVRKVKKSSKSASANARSDNLEVDVGNMGLLEIAPRMVVAQPNESTEVWFKATPSRSGYLLLKNGDLPYQVQAFIRYLNQGVETPIPLTITGKITTTDVTFSVPGKKSNELTFGDCSFLEVREIPLKITNVSRLPQKVNFNCTDPAIRVVFLDCEDIDGAVIVGPESSKLRKVRFEPTEIGNMKARICCHTLWNRNFELKCLGSGKKSLTRFDFSEVRFKSLSLGSKKTAKVRLMYEKKLKADLSASNFKNTGSIVKKIWDPETGIDKHLRQSVTRRRKSDDDLEYEFGAPKIVGIYQKTVLSRAWASKNQSKESVWMESQQMSRDSEQAAERVNPSYLKSFRHGSKIIGSLDEICVKNFDPDELFSVGEPTAQNPRIFVTSSVETLFAEGPAFPAFQINDAPPLSIHPKAGVIGPGEENEIAISLEPPSLAKLLAYKLLKNTQAPERVEADDSLIPSPSAEEAAVTLEKGGKVPVKKEDIPPLEQDELGTKDVEIVYSCYASPLENIPLQDSIAIKPDIATMLEKLDDTCLVLIVPCKIRKMPPLRTVGSPSGKSNPTFPNIQIPEHKVSLERLYLKVIAPIVRPDLVILEPVSAILTFGTVPVDHEWFQEFVICNIGPSALDLWQYQILGDNSPFRVASDMNVKLAPYERYKVTVSFKPHSELTFSTRLQILSPIGCAQVTLNGEGIIPIMRVEPEDKELFLGDIAVGDVGSRTFKVFNDGYSALPCKIQISSPPNSKTNKCHSPGSGNLNLSNPFSVSPWHVSIPASSSQEFTIKFKPDHECDTYHETVSIIICSNSPPIHFQVHGRCWDSSSTLLGYDRPHTGASEQQTWNPTQEFEYAKKLYNSEFPKQAEQLSKDDDGDGDNEGSILNKSTLSIAAGSESKGSNSKLAADSKKKTAVKESKDGANNAFLQQSEEVLAEMVKLTSRVNRKYVTVTCPWKMDDDTGKWYVEMREIQVAALKPANFVKPETKRNPSTEYIIEKWEGNFGISGATHDTAVQSDAVPYDAPFAFSPDSSKGTVELGATKPIQFKLLNPVQEFQKSQHRITKLLNHSKVEEANKDTVEQTAALFPSPCHVETYFKVSLKGGLRYTEPKGLISNSESRVWFVKFITSGE
ncbi:hypothetical protein HDU78_010920 [Chytriomyces hyalinus]|nr:hypothetical protein HDU78_010920 [Chytriomyces hyalinus]